MKQPKPSILQRLPSPPEQEERTGTFRLPLHHVSRQSQAPGQEVPEPAPSEARLLARSVPPPGVQAKPVVAARHPRLLLAVASEDVMYALLPVIRALGAAVVKVEDGAALEHALRVRGPFDVVLSDSHLPGGTGLGVLAGLRRAGHLTPFVIVQSIHQQLVRVVVGGGNGGVLSNRVVNDLALVELVEDLLGPHDAPTSSRRPDRIKLDAAGT